MTVREIAMCLGAQVLCCPEALDNPVASAFGSDLMSDVLAFAGAGTALLTGLMTGQAVRTAEMIDVTCIVFVRGKMPMPDVVEMARERGIPVICSRYTMYETCGRLYENGLPACPKG